MLTHLRSVTVRPYFRYRREIRIILGISRETHAVEQIEFLIRDEIEILKCQLENLEKENAQLKDDISDAIELGTVCFLCHEKDACSGPAPRNIDTDEGHNYGDVCPEGANPGWIGMPENADE